MEPKLARCPFCGGEPRFYAATLKDDHDPSTPASVECHECDVIIEAGHNGLRTEEHRNESNADAIRRWNTRH